jgi:hypothetical protein
MRNKNPKIKIQNPKSQKGIAEKINKKGVKKQDILLVIARNEAISRNEYENYVVGSMREINSLRNVLTCYRLDRRIRHPKFKSQNSKIVGSRKK